MANPTCTATLNKSSYNVGETLVLTVDHTDADRQTLTVEVVVRDQNGNPSPPSVATATIDAGVIEFTNTGGKTWVLQAGATLNRSVFHATA
jgi:hypothetical protein